MFQEIIEYIKDNPNKYWFKARLFGWGWTPVTWQGWVATLVYIAVLISFAERMDAESDSATASLLGFFIPFIVLTGLFIGLCFWKGEKPRWQWGPPKK